ncbi:anti-sigma factor family protein [Streptomyces endophyticus]|uniref:Zf-HC2 domain-containing protein n=1 Tax=Streptomyces endophyticus TaxID=714166 RepID=A0ABU6EXB8_9ACTN|nr:zf-HC2 domain-containing protein [Streptomyces endophyticus]MEB8336380.1 zf-HC2 domain-containing protein [Streptomyces endophyticus]
MSGSRLNPAERQQTAADEHLGDRLAALVDGELDHDARERVLAHLATCAKCKAEADAQRRLKSVFAQAAPPPPSDSFLARLQGLPAGGDTDGGTSFGGGGFGSGRPLGGIRGFGQGVFDVDPEPFGYAPSGAHAAVLPSDQHGFRIHEVTRPDRHESDRSSRSRRFAFAAAGAVSLAAIALGGVTTAAPVDNADARGGGSGSNVTPLRNQPSGAASASDTQRRRSNTSLLGQRGGALAAPVSPTEAGAPLLPGGGHAESAGYPFSTPLLAGAARMSPLIRPAAPAVAVSFAPRPSAPPSASSDGTSFGAGLAAASASLPTASSRPSSLR